MEADLVKQLEGQPDLIAGLRNFLPPRPAILVVEHPPPSTSIPPLAASKGLLQPKQEYKPTKVSGATKQIHMYENIIHLPGGWEDAPSAIELFKGAVVEVNFKGRGKYYPGKITGIRGDDAFDITYDDGDFESYVERSMIRLLESTRSQLRNALPCP